MKMRASLVLTLLTFGSIATPAHAGWPWGGPWPWSHLEGSRRVDVIGPLGNRLPPSYRREYNRPTYLGGKITAKIEPSSQEAMAFHRADELGLYDDNGIKGWMAGKHCPPQRVEQHYFYPKPWEVLTVGPRRDRNADASSELEELDDDSLYGGENIELVSPVYVAPTDDVMELPPPPGNAE